MEFLTEGSTSTVIDGTQAGALVERLLEQLRTRGPLRRVLLLPPDYSRLESGAGTLTRALYQRLCKIAEVVVMPTIGTHRPMTDDKRAKMYPGIPPAAFRVHDWRNDIALLGEVPAAFVRKVSGGTVDFPIRVEVNRLLLEPWDAIISIGQLVPHEVIGIANHNKNIFVGAGGKDIINRSHYLGAVYGMERIMGRAKTPVRDVLDYASANFAARLPIVYLLTVRQIDANGNLVTRGLFAGDDAACFRRGAELSRQVNLFRVDRAPKKVVVYLDSAKFQSTWIGNKAIYRSRMAIADGGELIVLAPGVHEFGEDDTIDALIRRHGYRGTPATIAATARDPGLAANLAAPAHLIHGSSEGRFRITYCPGSLTRDEVQGVGFGYGDLAAMLDRYNPDQMTDGWNNIGGEEVYFIRNPSIGLWGTPERFGDN